MSWIDRRWGRRNVVSEYRSMECMVRGPRPISDQPFTDARIGRSPSLSLPPYLWCVSFSKSNEGLKGTDRLFFLSHPKGALAPVVLSYYS